MTPISGLITGGLGLPASIGILTYHFHLFAAIRVTVTSGSGYSKVFQPGEYAQSYKYVNPNTPFKTPFQNLRTPAAVKIPYYIPVKLNKTDLITVSFAFGDKTITKEYTISSGRLGVTIKILNVVDSTRKKIVATTHSVKRVANTVRMTITKILKRNINKNR